MKKTACLCRNVAVASALLPLASAAWAAESPAASVSKGWQKPAWVTDLSAGVKECYDDNVLLVADKSPGLSPKSSWITTLSPKVGFNFAPLLGTQKTIKTLSLTYSPDFSFYHNAPDESYNAHKIADSIKGKTGDFSFSGDNAFLFNDGEDEGPIYAVGQGAASQQYDKNRSAYATAVPRERRKQIQDRATILLQYDVGQFFVRPTAALTYYDLMTDWHKTSAAPYKGYQNYVDRADVNGGVDLGYKVMTNLAFTVGYRYGHQYQQAYTANVDSTYQSSSDYQRALVGVEGQPLSWLTIKVLGGPDFRDYNSTAPMSDYHQTAYYGEGSLVATISANQSLTFSYKHWRWVSSTGKVAYDDSSYGVVYHVNATKQLGFDLGFKYANSDYTCGSAVKSGNSSLRDDAMYTFSGGVSYAFTKHLSASLTYQYDLGDNQQGALAVPPSPDYRGFNHQLVSLGAQYKF